MRKDAGEAAAAETEERCRSTIAEIATGCDAGEAAAAETEERCRSTIAEIATG